LDGYPTSGAYPLELAAKIPGMEVKRLISAKTTGHAPDRRRQNALITFWTSNLILVK
jgi:hypothetical protein